MKNHDAEPIEPKENVDNNRRILLRNGAGAAVLGVAATLGAGSAKAENSANKSNENPAKKLLHPAKAYPAPPYPAQQQAWPGIQSKMEPVPNCGEQTYQGSGRMKGRKALIVGGDSGIGRAVAIAFAREGADIALNYLPQEQSDAEDCAKYIRQAGRKIFLIPGDLRDENFCNALTQEAAKQLGGLDCLIVTAGRQKFCDDITQMTTEDFDWTVKTNLYALFWLIRGAAKIMPEGSAIVTTASRQASSPSPTLVDYAMTKAGIANMTQSLGTQLLIQKGIRINCVAPGPVWTPLQVSGAVPKTKFKTLGGDSIASFGSDTAFHRPAQPVELAPLYVTLASNESNYTTGEIWGSTGGHPVPPQMNA
ncbi:short-chain dehydrogenase reductase sdr [Lasius niger]|uniref:Short-chain dehydrogenase reductase sdr n=1 Tax=Lasius niger TaxID=67767 RepID=A0A0J7KGY8_LASNI|nr:short-chain dehydrogenase reductase sdr [Lasius niger]